MTMQHEAIRHLEHLRQAMSQDQKPIGFFLSAGCPLAVEMPDNQYPLIPDVERLTKWVNQELNGDTNYKTLLSELKKAGQNENNIEEILSFIRGLLMVSKGGNVRGFEESGLRDLEKKVCVKIVEKMSVSLPNHESPYHQLAKWISSIDREIPIEIFTTNYDLLMEQALDDLEVPYFDGFVGSRNAFFDLRAVESNLIPKHWTRLWKIHGSINWQQELENNHTKVTRFSSPKVVSAGSHIIYPSHLKYEQSRKMPYLALSDQLGRFIRQKSSILIMSGYSFNDAHINDVVINSLKANPTGMVLALMFDTYENGKNPRYPKAYDLASNQHNLSVWTFDRAVIGTNVGEWIVKQSEDLTINRFVEDGQQIRLGDFKIMTQFLRTFIGFEENSKNAK